MKGNTMSFDKATNIHSVEKFGYYDALFYNYSAKFHQQVNSALVNNNSSRKGHNVTFQAATKRIVTIGQFFGLNPVLGVSETDTSELRFSFFAGRCLYSIISIFMQSALFTTTLYKSFNSTDSKLTDHTSVVFYGTNTMTTILFLQVAIKWPKLSNNIARVEATNPNTNTNVVRRCNVACLVILALALLEHALSDLSCLAIAKDCFPDKSGLECFCLQAFPWIWKWCPYNSILGFLAVFINLQLTFNWNFADAFVICISIYLTARLEQINDKLIAMRGKLVPSSFWRVMREEYTRTSNLVRKVDDVIGGIIFISFANNLFFICLQLLNTFDGGFKASSACDKGLDDRPLKGYEQVVYFVYSFSFLLSRSLAVSLIAARVHTAGQKPAQFLYDVPSASYCIEVQRFLCQVHGNTVALSGLKFFIVRRGMVLTVAGTIVTYELVLMQFAGVSPTVAPALTP